MRSLVGWILLCVKFRLWQISRLHVWLAKGEQVTCSALLQHQPTCLTALFPAPVIQIDNCNWPRICFWTLRLCVCGQVCSSQAGVIGCSWHCGRLVVLWFCVCGILQRCPCLCKGVWHTSTLCFTTVYPTVCPVQASLNLYVILELMRISPWKWYCVYVEGKEMDHTALWENKTREKTHISHTI